jgi:hypothetical protein
VHILINTNWSFQIANPYIPGWFAVEFELAAFDALQTGTNQVVNDCLWMD